MLDSIEKEFELSPEKLHEITHRFIHDFNVGLSKYNEAMAMMCVFFTLFSTICLN